VTADEFNIWKRQFFVQYPSAWEWLQKNSPDVRATLRHWCQVLEPYTLDECWAVLDKWAKQGSKPFEAYERDQIPYLAKSTAQRTRDAAAKREQVAIERHYRDAVRSGNAGEALATGMATTLGKLGMNQAILELRPLHARHLAGELSAKDYDNHLQRVLSEL
jgi:hypothetical protein